MIANTKEVKAQEIEYQGHQKKRESFFTKMKFALAAAYAKKFVLYKLSNLVQ